MLLGQSPRPGVKPPTGKFIMPVMLKAHMHAGWIPYFPSKKTLFCRFNPIFAAQIQQFLQPLVKIPSFFSQNPVFFPKFHLNSPSFQRVSRLRAWPRTHRSRAPAPPAAEAADWARDPSSPARLGWLAPPEPDPKFCWVATRIFFATTLVSVCIYLSIHSLNSLHLYYIYIYIINLYE